MDKSIKIIKEYYKNEESLRRRLILLIIPSLIIMGIVSLVLVCILGIGTIQIFQAISSFLVPIAIMGIGFRKKAYDTSYTAICIFLCCVLYPSAVITTGGAGSGMIILCAGSLLLCGLCSTRKMRSITFLLSVIIDTGVYYICIRHPEWTIPMDQNKSIIFTYVCYLFTGLSLFAVSMMFINIFDLNSRVLKVLRKHMDETVCSELVRKDAESNLGVGCNAAIMFADICNFTSLSESMDTETLTEFLNSYFEITYEAISKNGGTIDKYIGDCVMAFWRDADNEGEAAVKACQAALDIKRMLKERCSEINDRFKCDLEFTAGINYGPAYVGDVGSDQRKDFTAIGDTVNVASRIQEIAPKGAIYLSDSTAKAVTGKAFFSKVPKKVAIRGKCDPMDIYTLVSMGKPKVPTIVVDNHNPTGYILYVCGSRGSYSLAGKRYEEFGGETSCYLFKKGSYALVVDCGSGLQRARALLEDCINIDIVITHLHYDHVIGLMDFSIFPKDAKLRFYGNFDEWLGDKSLSKLFDAPYWPANLFRGEMVSVNVQDDYQLSQEIKLHFYPASHPNNANLVVVYIQDKKVCVMADTENPDDLPFETVDHCDILIFDGMYEDKYYHEHIGWGHSTWESGVRLALKANPNRLIISHHNPRNSDEKLRGLEIQAQEEYPATTFAKAGDRFVL